MKRAYEYMEEAPFYRKQELGRIEQYERIKSIEKGNQVFGFGGDEVLLLEWAKGNIHYECYVDNELFPMTKKYFYFKVSKSICDLLTNLERLTDGCTDSSIKTFFNEYPYTYRLVRKNFLGDSIILWRETYIRTGSFCSKNEFISKAKEFVSDIDNLLLELNNMKLDTSKLKRQEPIISGNSDIKIPKWVFVAAATATVIAIKLIVRSVGQDVDISIPDFDGDCDTSNIDANIDYTPEAYANIEGQYNIAFNGSTDTITVHQEGNSSRTITLEVEKVAGTAHTWDVKKGGKVIATINSLTNGRIYIPGFGTGVL